MEWAEDEGLIHVIEEEERFDRRIVYEIFGSLTEEDDLSVRAPKEYSSLSRILFEQQQKYHAIFKKKFQPFDWTLHKL